MTTVQMTRVAAMVIVALGFGVPQPAALALDGPQEQMRAITNPQREAAARELAAKRTAGGGNAQATSKVKQQPAPAARQGAGVASGATAGQPANSKSSSATVSKTPSSGAANRSTTPNKPAVPQVQ